MKMTMTITKKKLIYILLFTIVTICMFPLSVKADTTDSGWVIVENYSVSENRMVAGDTGTLSLCLKNTNSQKDAKNIVVTLESATDDVLTADGLTNQSFIDHIPAGKVHVLDIPLKISSEASGERFISANISYVNPNSGETGNNTVKLHFNVFRSAVEIESVELNDTTNELSIAYKNAGNSEIYDVNTLISGNVSGGVADTQESVPAGGSRKIVVPVNFTETGKQRVKIEFSYTSTSGLSVRSDPESFLVSVTNIEAKNKITNANTIENNVEKPEGISLWMILITCLIVVIATISIRFMQNYSDKEKKKRRMKNRK